MHCLIDFFWTKHFSCVEHISGSMRLLALNLNGLSIDKSTVREGSVVVEESDVDDDGLS